MRSLNLNRWLGAGATVVATIAVLASCGGGGGSVSAADFQSQANQVCRDAQGEFGIIDGQVELGRRLDLFLDERLLVRESLVLLAFDELDAVIDQVGGEVLYLLLRELDFLDPFDDLVVGQKALLLSRRYELLEFLDVGKSNVDSEHLSTTSGYDVR